MTADEFRKLALALPEAAESAHMSHPDFRVRNKIFATLGPDEEWGIVKLTPDQQASLVRAGPDDFEAFDNAWGRRGACPYFVSREMRNICRVPSLAMPGTTTAVPSRFQHGAPSTRSSPVQCALSIPSDRTA